MALAAIVFCSTLWAAFGQIAPESLAAPASTPSAAIAQAPDGCTTDTDGEWTPQHGAAASITESAWKTRILHAGFSAAANARAVVGEALTDSPAARAPAAPSYLLHRPLLI